MSYYPDIMIDVSDGFYKFYFGQISLFFKLKNKKLRIINPSGTKKSKLN